MATTKKPPRPALVADAGEILDLQPRQSRELAAAGRFGRLRAPTRAEREWYGIAHNARVVVNLGVVQRLKKAREKALVAAELERRRKARRRAAR